MKSCSKCGNVQPLDAFYSEKRARDGKASACKACTLERQAEYRRRNIDRIREYDRRRHVGKRATSSRSAAKAARKAYKQRTDAQVLEDRARLRPDGMKPCGHCRDVLPLSRFSFSRARPDGLDWICIGCRYKKLRKRALKKMVPIWGPTEDWLCIYCGGPFEEIEHMTPKALGGTDDPSNLAPSCRDCNRKKSALPWSEWEKNGYRLAS